MEDIHSELRAEFLKYADENGEISDVKAQRACWKFKLYPSTSQIYEIHVSQYDVDDDTCSSFNGLKFYEFCLLVAIIKNTVYSNEELNFTPFIRSSNKSFRRLKSFRGDVFLGGACNPTTWRFDVAIPFLKEKRISFYNPQVTEWDSSLIEIEENAKESAKVLFFVLDIRKTRGIASLVESGFLSGQGRNLVLVFPAEVSNNIENIEVKHLDETEFQSIHRSYLFIADLVQRQGIPIFTNTTDALKATRASLISNKVVQDLTESDGIVPVNHSFVNVFQTVRTLQSIFKYLDKENEGKISRDDVIMAIATIIGKQENQIKLRTEHSERSMFDFPEFCIEYSLIILHQLALSNPNDSIGVRSNSVEHASNKNIFLEFNQEGKSTIELQSKRDLHSAKNFRTTSSVMNEGDNGIIDHSRNKIDDNDNGKSNQQHISNKGKSKKWYNNKFCCLLTHCFKLKSKIHNNNNDNDNEREESTVEQGQENPAFCTDHQNSLEIRKIKEIITSHLIQNENYDLFLGGTCGNSTWREDVAIPMLQDSGCTYYDPKIAHSTWTRRLIPMEAEARAKSKVLVYVITNESTSTAALVEAAHFIGQKKKVVLHIQMLKTSNDSPPLTPMALLLQSSCSFPLSQAIKNNINGDSNNDRSNNNNNNDDDDDPLNYAMIPTSAASINQQQSYTSGYLTLNSPSINSNLVTAGIVDSSTFGFSVNSNNNNNNGNRKFNNLKPGTNVLLNKRLSNKLSTSDTGRLVISGTTGSDNNKISESHFNYSMNNISPSNHLPPEATKDHNRGRKYLIDIAHRAKVPIFPTINEAIAYAIILAQNAPSPNPSVWTSKV